MIQYALLSSVPSSPLPSSFPSPSVRKEARRNKNAVVELRSIRTILVSKFSLVHRMCFLGMKNPLSFSCGFSHFKYQVRTRAVSLQKYISSKEEILTHASKLQKAEFPFSLRLMGLRMSQFQDEDKHSPVDPTQKTLSEYILWKLNFQIRIYPLRIMPESSCKREEPGDSNSANDADEASLGSANGEIRWIDGYICFECSTELQLGFDEERREHADYHLAQFLQQEEKAHVVQDKVYHNAPHRSPNSRRRQKASSSGGKFTRGKKNL